MLKKSFKYLNSAFYYFIFLFYKHVNAFTLSEWQLESYTYVTFILHI